MARKGWHSSGKEWRYKKKRLFVVQNDDVMSRSPDGTLDLGEKDDTGIQAQSRDLIMTPVTVCPLTPSQGTVP